MSGLVCTRIVRPDARAVSPLARRDSPNLAFGLVVTIHSAPTFV